MTSVLPSNGLRRTVRIAFTWAMLWLAFWVSVMFVIGIVDPASIDPGEPLGMVLVFGSMGILTGVLFAGLFVWRIRHAEDERPALTGRVLRLGALASVLSQLPYLGHGDQGLAANINMAVLLSVVGSLVTVLWWLARTAPPRTEVELPDNVR